MIYVSQYVQISNVLILLDLDRLVRSLVLNGIVCHIENQLAFPVCFPRHQSLAKYTVIIFYPRANYPPQLNF